MTIENDETLQMYVEESQEHLADIENDLLAIEQAGADLDEELVNKVFRAAHSIKGGAGFMGLTTIKELSHKMENVLGMVRSKEMVPNPEIVNILLLSSDALKNLLENILESNDIDVSEHIEALIALTENALSEEGKEAIATMVDVSMPDGTVVFNVAEFDITNGRQGGKFIYLIELDLIHDVHQKDKNPLDVLKELEKTGLILESKINVGGVGTLEDAEMVNRVPFLILYATLLDPGMIDTLVEIEKDRIFELAEDMTTHPVTEWSDPNAEAFEPGQAKPEETTATPSPEEPEVVESKAPEPQLPNETEASTTEDQVSEPVTTPEETAAPEPPVEQEAPVKEDSVASAQAAQTPPPAPPKQTASAPPPKPPAKAPAPPQGKEAPKKAPEMETNLRVNVSLLDSLMNLAGELVLSRNQLLQAINAHDMRTIQLGGQRLDLITSELQEAIMLTRMQPIGNVFNKFQRVVRDLARNLGKEVELVIEGSEVELDKTIIEAISDPLTHLVRNSADHGIESPDDRLKAGKKPGGQIVLKAYHEAGQVNIEIVDDGKGIDGNRVATSAVAKGLISEDDARVMSDKEKTALIFLPGFSTAEQVTDVSGRGVGMDVVKTNLDKLGGIVDIDSAPGKGTKVRIKLPLTLAIIPSQIITTGGDRYAIPQVNMDELLRIPASQIHERIERVGGAEVVRLRGQLLPLIKLNKILGVRSTYVDPADGYQKSNRRENLLDRRRSGEQEGGEATAHNTSEEDLSSPKEESPEAHTEVSETPEAVIEERRENQERRFHSESAVNIVVVSTGALKYGLVVDRLHDSEEIVVKPLGRHLTRCKGYAGATIMGDGRVALILDVANLFQMAGLSANDRAEGADRVGREERDEITAKKDMQSLLVFRSSEDEQFSVTLSAVERIEKIKLEDIEYLGGRRVMQYRGGSLPLFSIDETAQVKPLAEEGNLLVIVFKISGKEIGLMAIGPVDAMDVSVEVDGVTLKQPGIMGSAIIGGQTTQFVDIYSMVETLHPDWFEEKQKAAEVEEGEAQTILMVEDSTFFRNQVKNYMEEAGYQVVEAEDGVVAWECLEEQGDTFDLIVTDIEMPNMNGFELTKKIKADERFSHLTVIALTTLAGDADIAKGKAVGIDDYQIKLDRERLMESVQSHLPRP